MPTLRQFLVKLTGRSCKLTVTICPCLGGQVYIQEGGFNGDKSAYPVDGVYFQSGGLYCGELF